MSAPSCDVVITTRNRPDALRRCLTGLRGQSIDKFGVIVVDDGSDPPLETTLGMSAAAGLDLKLLTLPRPSGPAAGRNAGVAASDAEYIVFVDDDVYANHRFMEAHLAAVTLGVADTAPIVSCGPFLQPADWKPTAWTLWEARQLREEAQDLVNGVYEVTWRQFHTGNNCLSRAVFLAVGGFDEGFKRAEDDELGLRLQNHGCLFHFEPEAIAWHYSKRSLDSWLAIPRAYAHYDVEIDRKYPAEHYLTMKKSELARRRLPLRIARAVFGGPRRSRIGVQLAVGAANGLYRVGGIELAMAGLSVAYDLSYVDSLRQSERALSRA